MPDPIEEARDQAVFGVESAVEALFAVYSAQGVEPLLNEGDRITDAWRKLTAIAGAVAVATHGRAAA
jgi:hypothetical protein